MTASRIDWRRTIASIARGAAPSAIRIASSRDRIAMRYDETPYSPIVASRSPIAPIIVAARASHSCVAYERSLNSASDPSSAIGTRGPIRLTTSRTRRCQRRRFPAGSNVEREGGFRFDRRWQIYLGGGRLTLLQPGLDRGLDDADDTHLDRRLEVAVPWGDAEYAANRRTIDSGRGSLVHHRNLRPHSPVRLREAASFTIRRPTASNRAPSATPPMVM